MNCMVPILAVVLTAAAALATQESGRAGSIVGCVSDTTRQQLPGATVVAKGGGLQRRTVADSAGCYALNDLPPASYRVTARLLGFDNVTRDRVVVAPAAATHLDLTTRVSSICECIEFRPNLSELYDRADAVLHVRLSDSEPVPSTPDGYHHHTATVLNAIKEPAGPRSAPIFVLQDQQSGAPDPYDVGQELIAFLESSAPNAFRITTEGSYESMVFLVQDGRIQRAPSEELSRYVGTPISSFLEELRTLSRRK